MTELDLLGPRLSHDSPTYSRPRGGSAGLWSPIADGQGTGNIIRLAATRLPAMKVMGPLGSLW